jgi:hypothetical protein
MKTRKIASIVTVSLITISNAAYADLEIVPNSEPSIGNESIEERTVLSQIDAVQSEKINVEFKEMALAIVIDALKPKSWKTSYMDGTDNKSVTWSGDTDNWYDAVKFVGVANDLTIEIDFSSKVINVSEFEASKNKNLKNGTNEIPQVQPQKNINAVVVATQAQTKADEMIECKDESCSTKVVNIEKLVFDTTWVNKNAEISYEQ